MAESNKWDVHRVSRGRFELRYQIRPGRTHIVAVFETASAALGALERVRSSLACESVHAHRAGDSVGAYPVVPTPWQLAARTYERLYPGKIPWEGLSKDERDRMVVWAQAVREIVLEDNRAPARCGLGCSVEGFTDRRCTLPRGHDGLHYARDVRWLTGVPRLSPVARRGFEAYSRECGHVSRPGRRLRDILRAWERDQYQLIHGDRELTVEGMSKLRDRIRESLRALALQAGAEEAHAHHAGGRWHLWARPSQVVPALKRELQGLPVEAVAFKKAEPYPVATHTYDIDSTSIGYHGAFVPLRSQSGLWRSGPAREHRRDPRGLSLTFERYPGRTRAHGGQ